MSLPLAMLRIEHKLDLLIHFLQNSGSNGGFMLPPGALPQLDEYDTDICPVCGQPINLTIDVMNETYNRSCGCKPRVQLVPGISRVMTPPSTGRTDKESDDAEVPAPDQAPEPSSSPGSR